jgi:hypothetical protein
MKIRELLQIEIWSKETSRKILVRTRKILVRVGIVFGILVVVLGIILAIEMSWLTSGERKVASAALVEIDEMQNLVQAGGNDFEARDQQAKETVEAADRAAWTLRDKGAAYDLSFYLYLTESDRHSAELETEARAMMRQRNVPWPSSDPEREKLHKKLKDTEMELRLTFRSAVLKALH